MPAPSIGSVETGSATLPANSSPAAMNSGDLPPLSDVVTRPGMIPAPGMDAAAPGGLNRAPGIGGPSDDQLPAMARDFDSPTGVARAGAGHSDSLLDPKSDFKTADLNERLPVPEEMMGPPASLARTEQHHPAKTHNLALEQDGPAKTVTKGVDGAAQTATPAAPGSKEAQTQNIVKNATTDTGVFGSIKQYILEHPEAVALAVGLATASMGGGWKWSIAAAGAGWLGTNLLKGWTENSKKADALDKVASLHNIPGVK